MKRYLIVLFFFPIVVFGQNLVPNPSFEVYDSCPHYVSGLFYATPWFQPCTYYGNTLNSCSSDLYSNCCTTCEVSVPSNSAGLQFARTGSGYSGIFCNVDTANIREYIEVELSSPLINNNQYCIEFYVSLADDSKKAISSIGVYFSMDSLLDPSLSKTISYVVPQVENDTGNFLTDKNSWMKISGSFIASGGERFMTIGNFKTPINTYFQNVSGGATNYVYYYIDDISVTECDTTNGIIESTVNLPFKLYPNPLADQLFISVSDKHVQTVIVDISDITGKRIYSNQLNINNLVGQLKIDLDNGVYLVKITDTKNKKESVQKIVINK